MNFDKIIVFVVLLIGKSSSYCYQKQSDRSGVDYCSCDRPYKKMYYGPVLCQTVFNICAFECSSDLYCHSFNVFNDNVTCFFFNTNNCLKHSNGNCFNFLAQNMFRSMFVTVDNTVKEVYVDGVDYTTKVGSQEDWKGLGQFYYPYDARVIAVYAKNLPGGDGGLLVRSNDGYISTDTVNWRCVNYSIPGWSMEDFNDSNWPLAFEVVDVKSSLFYYYIHAGSKWIWTANSREENVYCRAVMRPYRQLLKAGSM